MGNTKQPRRRRRKPGDTAALRHLLWEALLGAERVLIDPSAEPELVLRAVATIATASGVYANVMKVGTIADDVESMREEVRELRASLSRPASRPDRSAAPTVN